MPRYFRHRKVDFKVIKEFVTKKKFDDSGILCIQINYKINLTILEDISVIFYHVGFLRIILLYFYTPRHRSASKIEVTRHTVVSERAKNLKKPVNDRSGGFYLCLLVSLALRVEKGTKRAHHAVARHRHRR